MSQVRFLSQTEFHAIARSRPRGVGVRRPTSFIQRDGDESDLTNRLIGPWQLSDASIDRMSDSIRVSGWQWDNYMRAGGPVQWAHDTQSPPIGGMRSIWATSTALYGNIEMANTEMGETVLGLINARMLRAGSVGFLALRWQYSTDPARAGGIDFRKLNWSNFPSFRSQRCHPLSCKLGRLASIHDH